MSAMKESVKNERECTSSIINRDMEEIQKEFRPYFPTEVSMKRTLQRHRRKGQPALLKSLADADVAGIYVLIFQKL